MVSLAASADDRYSRQKRFVGIGAAGQARLRSATVAVIGCGGLGSSAISLLARSGVGSLVIVDRDVVETSNLHRQVLYDEADAAANLPKAVAAAAAVARMNSQVRVRPVIADVTPGNVESIIDGAQAVIDATDNLETRYLVNDACVAHGIPWVYGGAVGSSGMSMTIIPGRTACFRCLFPQQPPAGSTDTCDTVGVLASNVVAVAAHQWTEVVKLLVGAQEQLAPGLVVFDVWSNQHDVVAGIERREDCPCCGQRRFDYLRARGSEDSGPTAVLFGQHAVQVTAAGTVQLDLERMRRELEGGSTVSGGDHVIRFVAGGRELTVFADGRAIVNGTTDVDEARTLYARYVRNAPAAR